MDVDIEVLKAAERELAAFSQVLRDAKTSKDALSGSAKSLERLVEALDTVAQSLTTLQDNVQTVANEAAKSLPTELQQQIAKIDSHINDLARNHASLARANESALSTLQSGMQDQSKLIENIFKAQNKALDEKVSKLSSKLASQFKVAAETLTDRHEQIGAWHRSSMVWLRFATVAGIVAAIFGGYTLL